MRTITVGLALLLAGVSFAGLAAGQIIGGDILPKPPVINSVTIDDEDGTVLPSAGGNVAVTATAVVTDPNGLIDILPSSGVTMALVFGGSDVIAEGAAPRVSASGLAGTYERTFSIPYYFEPGTYTIRVKAVDITVLSVTDTSETFTYAELLAASPAASVSLGSSLEPGDSGLIVPLAVSNTGNVVLDVQVVAAGALVHTTISNASIAASSVEYGVASNLAGASTLVTSSPPTLDAFNLAVATSGSGSSQDLYFRLNVPSVAASPGGYLPGGTYQTTLTVTAVANP